MIENNFNKLYEQYDVNKFIERKRYCKTINYIFNTTIPFISILDMGERSEFTVSLEENLGKVVDNTIGDLDLDFSAPKSQYDLITYIHTIEHQFNPLYSLIKLRELLSPNGRILVEFPQRIKILWTNHHYHEIDHYRFGELVKTANLEIVKCTRWKLPRPFYQYLTGVRSIMRLFQENIVMYELKR